MTQGPRDFPCPRCGAPEKNPCEPVRQPSKFATVLRMHSERGAMPWVLERDGYVKYVMADEDGQRYYLWRKPKQPQVERPGWTLVTDDERNQKA